MTAAADRRPVVVGGGMSGLVLARALTGLGRDCTVLERAGALEEVGAGVQLSPRSVHLLARVGALAPLLERAVAVEAREVRSWRGEVISRTPLGGRCEERYGAPYLTVHRADLQEALAQGVAADTLRLGSEVVDVGSGPDGVRVALASGEEVVGGLVVGADGIRSTVRRSLARDTPVASGLTAYRALVPTALLPAEAGDPVVRIWVGPGAHAVAYPVRGGELLNLVAVVPSGHGAEDWSATAPVDDLLGAFLGWDGLLGGIVAAVEHTRAWALHDREPLHRLAVGRVALVGDAAHPMLPFAAQGVNQAVEDAWVLARCLAAPGPADATARLDAYSRLRAPRAAQAQVASRHLAASLHVPDGPERESRDAHLVAGAALSTQDDLLAPLGWSPPA